MCRRIQSGGEPVHPGNLQWYYRRSSPESIKSQFKVARLCDLATRTPAVSAIYSTYSMVLGIPAIPAGMMR